MAWDTQRLKTVNGEKIFHGRRNDKKAEVTILISDKIYFKKRPQRKKKKDIFIIIKDLYKRILHLSTYIHPIGEYPNTKSKQQQI